MLSCSHAQHFYYDKHKYILAAYTYIITAYQWHLKMLNHVQTKNTWIGLVKGKQLLQNQSTYSNLGGFFSPFLI